MPHDKHTTEEPAVDLEALSDLCTPWCLHVAVTLRIAEHIAAGVAEVGALAAAAACDAYVLQRVLEHLVGKGVFTGTEYGHFGLNAAARQLLDPGVRIGLDLSGIGGRMAGAWATLPAFVKTGAPAYHEVFGRPFWDDLDAHPEVASSFDALIGSVGHGTPDPDFALADGWERINTVVDVGGGTGAMLAEILRAHSHITGTLVDLPRTVALAAEVFETAGVSDRAAVSGQSFFDPLPEGADLYLLRGVLNDWPDREAGAILRRCAEAAGSVGSVVVIKGVGLDGPPRGLSIEMVLAGGRQRTIAEFTELARQSGLDVVAVSQQKAGHSVVECEVL